ncbi:hypoxanthine phosphoribosyltransferase [Lactobacillaceae bacterium Melli_B4]
MNNDILKTVCDQQQIQEVCKRLGKEITKDYQGKQPLVVGVLKGAIFFMTDVVRYMDLYLSIDFIDVSSYNGGTESSGKVQLIKDLDSDVKGRDVIIIEDIIETGRTLKYLQDLLKDRGANSIKVCALVDKPEARVVESPVDYVGIDLPKEFLVGYGLDYQEQYRNLPYIGVLKPEIYKSK